MLNFSYQSFALQHICIKQHFSQYQVTNFFQYQYRNRTIMFLISTAIILRTDFNSPNSYKGMLRNL